MHWISMAARTSPCKLRVAVDVLHEMAIDAVHALFQVNVHQMDRHAVLASRVSGVHRPRRSCSLLDARGTTLPAL